MMPGATEASTIVNDGVAAPPSGIAACGPNSLKSMGGPPGMVPPLRPIPPYPSSGGSKFPGG